MDTSYDFAQKVKDITDNLRRKGKDELVIRRLAPTINAAASAITRLYAISSETGKISYIGDTMEAEQRIHNIKALLTLCILMGNVTGEELFRKRLDLVQAELDQKPSRAPQDIKVFKPWDRQTFTLRGFGSRSDWVRIIGKD